MSTSERNPEEIKAMVRKYCHATGTMEPVAWDWLWSHYKEQHGVHPPSYAQDKDISALEWAEREGITNAVYTCMRRALVDRYKQVVKQ